MKQLDSIEEARLLFLKWVWPNVLAGRTPITNFDRAILTKCLADMIAPCRKMMRACFPNELKAYQDSVRIVTYCATHLLIDFPWALESVDFFWKEQTRHTNHYEDDTEPQTNLPDTEVTVGRLTRSSTNCQWMRNDEPRKFFVDTSSDPTPKEIEVTDLYGITEHCPPNTQVFMRHGYIVSL